MQTDRTQESIQDQADQAQAIPIFSVPVGQKE